MEIVHYCCGSYDIGDYGGVARYDHHFKLTFPSRRFFAGPRQRDQMLAYLSECKSPIVITDNHLSLDIPNKYPVLLVHHGCAKVHALREPGWSPYWRDLCCNGQDKMLDHRDPAMTKIISISQFCTDSFMEHYGTKYSKFRRLDVLHSSELPQGTYKRRFHRFPIVLGNWSTPNKGRMAMSALVKSIKWLRFAQLSVKIQNNNIDNFNIVKQGIYCNSDMFLQLSTCEGNSYATLDALLCGLVVIATDVGLFYKDIPENCFVKLEWRRVNDVPYVTEKIKYAWHNRHTLARNARDWYLKNCGFAGWQIEMTKTVKAFHKEQYPKQYK